MQREFITFEVNGQTFGFDIMAILEIRAWTAPARLPHVPPYVAGVINLRGTILPVIDLAVRFGWPGAEATARHAMIVTQVNGQARGLIVDSVSDIVTIESDAMQSSPQMADERIVSFLEGVAAIDDMLVMVLDLAALNAEQIVLQAA
ncbi:MAG: chemotaxis protein CheW [Novosphingobium sp.]